MSKLLLLSCLIALVVLPIFGARDKNPLRGLKRAMFFLLAFNLFYIVALRVIYPRLS